MSSNLIGHILSSAVTVTTTSQVVAVEYDRRRHFSIQNNGAVDIYIHFGAGAATVANGIKVSSGGLYEPFNPGAGPIAAIAASSTAACIVSKDG